MRNESFNVKLVIQLNYLIQIFIDINLSKEGDSAAPLCLFKIARSLCEGILLSTCTPKH
jgi:hypothetical protein